LKGIEYEMKRIVVFSGAGMSADSGIKTFRDSGGLWEEYDVYEVATPEAWQKDPALVLNFYNMRRQQVLEATPNAAHEAIARLEQAYDVQVVTQNIDDLHERAGSSSVLHLHGEIMKMRGEHHPDVLYPVTGEIMLGDLCPSGSQLRPHVVWFGEAVTEMTRAAAIMKTADIVLIVGTSLNVYPAAGLVHYAPSPARRYLIDPAEVETNNIHQLETIQATAAEGVPKVVDLLLKEALTI
jgi:NAD-dependent deacetylase